MIPQAMDETRQKLAILYADVSGSTRLYEKFGDKVARSDVAICLKLLSDVVMRLQGIILKTIGDEIMCQFTNPVKAALAACEMQESLRDAGEAGRFQSGPLRIKIGWHYGDVTWRGHEVIGEAPVMAQQIIAGARAGEILTSAATVHALPGMLAKKAYPMGSITSEITGAQVPIFGIRWEETAESTEISDTGEKSEAHGALVLEYRSKKVRVDETHPWCLIGRAHENEICVEGQYASRLHAAIEYRHGNFHIKDQSVNGTVIHFNDGRILRLHREEGMLTGGGRIGIGCNPDDGPGSAITFYCK